MATFSWQDVLEVFSDETGLELEEITDDDDFTTLGINQLLAPSILARLRGPNGEPVQSNLFTRYITVGALRRYYEQNQNQSSFRASDTSKPQKTTSPSMPLSIVFQNNPSTSKHTVFLLPDGSGFGMAYANLPPVDPSVCVVGMNSPYLRSASQFSCSIEELVLDWVREIYRRQPRGPYILGGWSAGGYYSFEVAKRLHKDGHRVQKLILIDSPCRTVFESLPMEVVNYLASRNLMGNWGTEKPPDWLVQHFDATLRAVAAYHPKPIDKHAEMETYIIWSREGVQSPGTLKGSGLDLNVKVSRFLLEGKSNFGPNGWDQLVPSKEIVIGSTSGTHFTMINPPHVNEMSVLIRDAVVGISNGRQSQWHRYLNPHV
ncbi:Acyl carrier protein-like protein [Penicillium hispanicum]|uniref:Acyl carrier protein-like protein n=1 Tax=Penicillium hispanicum TaxID=1080232 RepID=UPI00254122B6|nr:Acyl carrier protein-like protein [Penicillium hispanicum]KAJ5594745.1 Acyl carrier protein-like protein [Penicillium hispanicum]